MRGVTRIITENLAVHELGNSSEWLQSQQDSISRRITSMKTFATGIKKNNNIRSTLMTCSSLGLGESSDYDVELTNKIINNGSNYLRLQTRKFDNLFVNEILDIPNPETFYVTNLSGSANTIDACNQECK